MLWILSLPLLSHALFISTCQSLFKEFIGRRKRLEKDKRAFSASFFPSVSFFDLTTSNRSGKLASKPNLCFYECSLPLRLQKKKSSLSNPSTIRNHTQTLPPSKAGRQKQSRKAVNMWTAYLSWTHFSRKTSQQLQLSEIDMHSAAARGYLAWRHVTVGQTSRWIWSQHHCSWRESNRWTWWCGSSHPVNPVRSESSCCHGTERGISTKT